MSQRDKLRNTLREYYDTRQVPFDENEWERASAYLNAARRGRRMRYAVLFLTALFSTLFIVVFNFPELTGNDKHQASSLSEQKLNSGSIPKSVVLHLPVAPERKIRSSISLNSGRAPGRSVDDAISAPETRRNIPEVQAAVSSNEIPQVVGSNLAASGLDVVEQKNTVKEGYLNNNIADIPITIANNTANGHTGRNDVEHQAPEEPKENAEMIPPGDENLTQGQNQGLTKEIPQVPVDVLPQMTETIVVNDDKKEISATDIEKFTIPQEPTPVAVVDTSRHVPASANNTTEIAVGDTLPGPSSSDHLAGEGIFYEAGAAWLYGWKGPGKRDARGFSPVAGINYINRLGNRYALSFGVQYLQVRNLSNSSKTSRVSSYKYGEQSRVTVITPSTVHYLVAPLRLHYYLDHRNSFGGGINLAYLLNVDATVTSYDERPGSDENYKTVKLGGYTEGFSWFDSQLAFFYRRRIGGSLALQAEIFMGLTDVKQDEFFGFRNKERNSGAKLSLVYYAFRKNSK